MEVRVVWYALRARPPGNPPPPAGSLVGKPIERTDSLAGSWRAPAGDSRATSVHQRASMATARQQLGEFGEQRVVKDCSCLRCKRPGSLLRLPPNFKCADVICDFCG